MALTQFEAIQYMDEMKNMIKKDDIDYSFLEHSLSLDETELYKMIDLYTHNFPFLSIILASLKRLSINGELQEYRLLMVDTLLEITTQKKMDDDNG